MKKEKNCKKSKENLVGKIIYSFLLFAPLLSILATCVYTIINENAKDSYYGETINEEQIHTGYTNLEERYYLTINEPNITSGTLIYNVSNVKQETGTNIFNNETTGIITFYYYYSNNTRYVRVDYNGENSQYINIANVANDVVVSFYLTSVPTNTAYSNYLRYKTYNKLSYMDNVFEYSIYKIENNDLYNWAKTTGTYTVVSNTTQLLGITNTFIPMLLTYWLIISIIYIIYDIGLIMVWIAHNKVHELLESV